MNFSGRIQIVYGLEGELTDAWRDAWRDYDWDADDEGRPDLNPQLRDSERGPEIWFDWEEGDLEYDLGCIYTAIEACNHGLRNAQAVTERRRQEELGEASPR